MQSRETEADKEAALLARVVKALEALVQEHYGMAPRSYALVLDLDDNARHLVPLKVDCVRDALMLIRTLRACASQLEDYIDKNERQGADEFLQCYGRGAKLSS